MKLSLSPISNAFQSNSAEALEKSGCELQATIQKNLSWLLRFLLPGFLILLTIYSGIYGLPLYDTLSKRFPIIGVFVIICIPAPWPVIQNAAFLFTLWLFELAISSDALLSFNQDHKILLFILGHTVGVLR